VTNWLDRPRVCQNPLDEQLRRPAVIWALLVLLGVPIWLIVGVLISVWYSRRHFRAQDGVFVLSIRAHGEQRWPRTPAYGRCLGGIIVVNRGVALLRTSINEVVRVDELEIDQPPRKPSNAVGRLVTLADGSLIDVAVAEADSTRLDALVPPRRPG